MALQIEISSLRASAIVEQEKHTQELDELRKATEEAERTREVQLAEVLRAFADRRERAERHVLLGDFNANAPGQMLVRERLKPSSQAAFDANNGDLPRRVVSQLLAAGYVDTFAARNADAAAVTCSFTTLHPGQRVDYVFAFGDLRVTGAWIEADRLATYASDHYPVGAELA